MATLQEKFKNGRFVITAEITPPVSCDAADLIAKAMPFKGLADAVNVTDGAGARAHLGAVTAAGILLQNGIEPILQFSCRDRNRIALQSDLMAAAALGVHNLLMLKGDDPKQGDQPDAKPVFDLDSLQLLVLASVLRGGRYLSGRAIVPAPDLLPGATENPFAPPYDFRPQRLMKKIEAGARFIQTQITFNVARFAAFMKGVRDLGLDRRVPILAGVAPLRSARSARYMQERVPGMEVPDAIVRRMEQAGPERTRREDEGIRICVEIIEQLREIPGLAGFHVMPIHWEEAVAAIAERARLRPARATLAAPLVAGVLDEGPRPREHRA